MFASVLGLHYSMLSIEDECIRNADIDNVSEFVKDDQNEFKAGSSFDRGCVFVMHIEVESRAFGAVDYVSVVPALPRATPRRGYIRLTKSVCSSI